jgi:hypothetical protein
MQMDLFYNEVKQDAVDHDTCYKNCQFCHRRTCESEFVKNFEYKEPPIMSDAEISEFVKNWQYKDPVREAKYQRWSVGIKNI